MRFLQWLLGFLVACILPGMFPVAAVQAQPLAAKTSFVVNKIADTNDGSCTLLDCSLREAVIAAQGAPGSVIYLPQATFFLTIGGSDENNSATGDLDTWVDTTIMGVAGSVVDASAIDRVINVRAGTLTVRETTLRNGAALTGAGIRVEAGAHLILENADLAQNFAGSYGGAVYVGTGSTALVLRSSLHANAAGQDGGGIYNLSGTVNVVDSTLSANQANRNGGGIYHYGPGKILGLYSSTLAANTADANGDGSGQGGGVYQNQVTSQVSITHTVIGTNMDLSGGAPDCLGVVNSLDYNLIQSTNGCILQGTTTHNLTGVDPGLEPLAYFGGTGLAHRIALNSPALDAGDPSNCLDHLGVPLLVDQRGELRIQDGNGDGIARCDIGAYEREPMPQALVTQISHTLSGSSQPHTSGAQVTIGELVTLHAAVTFPPGQAQGAFLTITLDPGLAWVSCDSLTAPGVVTSLDSLNAACLSPLVSAYPSGSLEAADQGRQAVLNLGNLTNPSGGSLIIGLTYTAALLNIPANAHGAQVDALLTWSAEGQSLDSPGQLLTVVEPAYSLNISVDPGIAAKGDAVGVNIAVAPLELGGFEVTLDSSVSTGISYDSNSLALESGLPPDLISGVAAPISASWSSLPGASALVYGTHLEETPSGEQLPRLTASLNWSSLPGEVSASLSPYNTLAVERTYIPEDPLNDYFLEDFAEVGAPARRPATSLPESLPATGFAPWGQGPAARAASAVPLGDQTGLRLEIPRLGVNLPIWSVPLSAQGWDLSWLGEAAGHLEGTAFPTWQGNSVLTGHAYLSNGMPGPFAFLPSLGWNDQLIVHAFGQEYVYAVREVTQVDPDDLSPLRHEELPWLTLISCRGYDPDTNTYRWRTVVRAVLIEVR